MWLLGRLVYGAENKRAVVPGLLKCLGAWPLVLRLGLEHLWEQGWRRHLAEECASLNSLLSGVGLALGWGGG